MSPGITNLKLTSNAFRFRFAIEIEMHVFVFIPYRIVNHAWQLQFLRDDGHVGLVVVRPGRNRLGFAAVLAHTRAALGRCSYLFYSFIYLSN